MRPGRKGPGNEALREAVRAEAAASMRPGRKGPGNPGMDASFARVVVCFNEAGAQRPRKHFVTEIRRAEYGVLQ